MATSDESNPIFGVGRKFLLPALGIVGVVVAGIWLNMSGPDICEYVTILVGVGVGGITIEDAVAKIWKKKG